MGSLIQRFHCIHIYRAMKCVVLKTSVAGKEGVCMYVLKISAAISKKIIK